MNTTLLRGIKSRLVTNGYSQEEGIDYDETYAPVAHLEAIRMFLRFAACLSIICRVHSQGRTNINTNFKSFISYNLEVW